MWFATIIFLYMTAAGEPKELRLTSKADFASQRECILDASSKAAKMVGTTTDTVVAASFSCQKANSI